MVIILRFCPLCGNSVEPDKKFCTNCGASLTPDLTGSGGRSPQVPPPASISRVTSPGISSSTGMLALAGLVVVELIVIFVGYPALTGSGILSAGGISSAHVPTPVPTTGSGNISGGSYGEGTPETPSPVSTTESLPLPTTIIPTTTATVPTTVPFIKTLVCPSDMVNCNNTCFDLRTNSSHCGFCGTACPSDQICLNGQCMKTCTPDQTSCPDGCFDLMSHPRHCGSCLNSCPLGMICYRGQCNIPATPMPVPQ